jgi:uncharacterized membrane protein YfcA
MDIFALTLLLLLVALGAGFLGSMTGLGGGVVIIPALTLLFGIDIHYAMGASLVSVIATSSGAAAAYVKEGFTNIRIGMFLESATTIGAVVGASLTAYLPATIIAVVFGGVLIFSAIESHRAQKKNGPPQKSDRISEWLRMPRFRGCWVSALAHSRSWRWTGSCGFRSRCPRRPVIL